MQFIIHRADRRTLADSDKRFLLAYGADPTGHTLSAGFITEESRDTTDNRSEVGAVVEHDHGAGTKRGSGCGGPFDGEFHVEQIAGDEGSCCAAEKDCSEVAAGTAGKFEQRPERGAEWDLVYTGLADIS